MNKIYFLIFLCFSFDTNAIKFSIDHLPISSELAKTFPQLNSQKFIISNKKSEMVLHEKDSKDFIKFEGIDKLIFALISLQSNFFQDNEKKLKEAVKHYLKTGNSKLLTSYLRVIEPKILDEYLSQLGVKNTLFNFKTNLYDLCCMFQEACDFFKDYDKSGIFRKIENCECFLFLAEKKLNCALKIITKTEEFFVILSGFSSEENLRKDIACLKTWLNQFFSYKVTDKSEKIAEIPVFYGVKSNYDIFLTSNHYIIVSNSFNKRIRRTFFYRTMLKAPIFPDSNIGSVFYSSAIFTNCIIKNIFSKELVEKSNRLKVILDSLSYIIFGSPYDKIKLHKSDDC